MSAPTAPAAARRTRRALPAPRLHGLVWLTWRQNRLLFRTGLAAAAAFALYAAVRHQQVAGHVARAHLAACRADLRPADASCAARVIAFDNTYLEPLRRPLQSMLALPLVWGMFAGAPQIAQELESGTHRTVLAQSAGRTRWLAAKLLVPLAVTAVVTGVFGAAMTWWWQPVARISGPRLPWWQWYPFDGIGPVPAATAVLTTTAGVLAGLLLRRTVLAMGATLAAGAAVTLLLEAVRIHLWPLDRTTVHGTLTPPAPDGAWVAGSGLLDRAGHHVTPFAGACDTARSYSACLLRHGRAGAWADFHPRTDLWALQWTEAGVCLAAAALLAAACLWLARRRAL